MHHRALFLVLGVICVAACVRPSREAASAGAVGCSPGDITISQHKQSYMEETWIAECAGVRHVCSHIADGDGTGGDINCSPEKVTKKELDAGASGPPGAAGFEFSMNAAQAESTCTDSGETWSSFSRRAYQCSGPAVDLAMKTSVSLMYCRRRLCEISLLSEDEKWVAQLSKLKGILEDKYGKSSADEKIEGRCQQEAHLFECIQTGEARFGYEWSWPSGKTIRLEARSDMPGVRLVYKKPTVATKKKKNSSSGF